MENQQATNLPANSKNSQPEKKQPVKENPEKPLKEIPQAESKPSSQEKPPNQKILKLLLIFLGFLVVVLVVEGVFYYRTFITEKLPAPEKTPQPSQLPLLTKEKLEKEIVGEKKADYPLVVNGNPVSWQELEEAIRYDQEVWNIRGHDSGEEKKLLIDRLIERKVVSQLAENQGFSSVSQEEINKEKVIMFGQNYDFSKVSSYPEFKAQVTTNVLKKKLEAQMTKTYSGALIYIKFLSKGSRELKAEGTDPQQLAESKAETLYQQYQEEDLTIEDLVSRANGDSQIMKLNDDAKMVQFEEIESDEISVPSREFEGVVKQMTAGEVSQVFSLSTVMRPDLGVPQDYAYGFVVLEESSQGEVSDFETFLKDKINKAEVKVNI